MKSYQKKTISQLSIAMLLSMMVNLVAAEAPYLGMGAKTGEVSANTAVINIRLSESIGQQRNHGIPGKLGKARIQYSLSEQMTPSFLSEWPPCQNSMLLSNSMSLLTAHWPNSLPTPLFRSVSLR